MKRNIKLMSVLLLSFIGFTALYGGWALMIDPSGEYLHIPVDKLKFSPFDDYFIPGAILFVVIGIGSLLLLPVVLKGMRKADRLLILAGMAMSGFIIVQMVMMMEVNWLHVLYLTAGVVLIFLGVRFKAVQKKHL